MKHICYLDIKCLYPKWQVIWKYLTCRNDDIVTLNNIINIEIKELKCERWLIFVWFVFVK